jgi:catechol 2,3-dioxygenase-like lactoylglutathione lyase family enzyme
MTKFLGLRPMLDVPDLPATIEFWTGVLGFTVQGRLDDDEARPLWCSLTRDDVGVMFTSHYHDDAGADGHHEPHAAELGGSLYLYVDDVDALAAELSAKVPLEFGPADMPYEMREIGVRDNNGFLLLIGQDIQGRGGPA